MKHKISKVFLIILIGGGIFFSSFFYVIAYSPYTTHSPLTERAVDLYNQFYSDDSLTSQQKQWIAQGSAQEDSPLTRPLYHFYDPINNKGLSGYQSSKEWARRKDLQASMGIYTWEEAIGAYNRGNYEYAYKTLGHILHLIQDATVPAHTRNDPHPHELYGGADPYEQGVKEFSAPNMAGMNPILYDNLDIYFDMVAQYTNTQFLSKDSLGFYKKPDLVRVDNNYVYARDGRGEYKLLKIRRTGTKLYDSSFEIYADAFSDPLVLRDYWNRLAPTAIENTAGIIKLFKDTVKDLPQQEMQGKSGFWGGLKNAFAKIGNVIASGGRYLYNLSSFVFQRHGLDLETFPVAVLQTGAPSVSGDNTTIGNRQSALEKKAGESFAQQISFLSQDFQTVTDEQAPPTLVEIEQELAEPEQTPTETELQLLPPQVKKSHTVTRVIDGDTIELENGQRVRYIGIDAPELPDGCFAQEAKHQNEQLVLNKQVVLESGPDDKDSYDRLLRYVWDGNNLINKNLVDTGHAYAFDFGFTHKFSSLFEKIENVAKENRYGLWGGTCHPELTKVEEYKKSEEEFSSAVVYPPSLINTNIVINEVSVDGGEFVELYNDSPEITYLSNYYFSYYPSSKVNWNDPYRNKNFPQAFKINPFSFFVVALGGYSGAYDWQAYSSNQLSNSAGTVGLFFGDPESGGQIIDGFGWNEVNLYEGQPYDGELLETASSSRDENHTDTNNNYNDFVLVETPTPGSNYVVVVDDDDQEEDQNDDENEDEQNEEDGDENQNNDEDDEEDEEDNDDGDDDEEEDNDNEEDNEAPSSITNLVAQSGDERGSVKLNWDAVIDNEGVVKYIVKYFGEVIRQDNWDAATEYDQDTTPQTEGGEEILVIDDLVLGNLYYFGIKAEDEAGNQSEISNIATAYPNATPNSLIINEVQVQDSEFIELYNPTEDEIDLSDYYFSYYSSGKVEWGDPYRNKSFSEAENTTIFAGGYYLIGLEGYSTANSNPNADWQPYSSAQLSNSKGTIAMFSEDPKEADSPTPTDAVAWGDDEDVTLKETRTTETPDDNESVNRSSQHWDSDNNFIDFTIGDATPRNSNNEQNSDSFSASPIWSSWQNLYTNSGLSKFTGPTIEPTIIWSEELEAPVSLVEQPVVDSDGNIYVSANEKSYSYSADGEERWSYTDNSYMVLSQDSQKIYLIDNKFTALNSVDGGFISSTNLLGDPANPVVDSDGNIYIVTKSKIYSFSADGNLNWEKDWLIIDWASIFDNGFTASSINDLYDPILYNEKLYVVVKPDSDPVSWHLLEIDTSTGLLNWQTQMEVSAITDVTGSPSVNTDGLLFVGYKQFKNKFGIAAYDLNSEGALQWKKQFASKDIVQPPAIDNDGAVYSYEDGKTIIYRLTVQDEVSMNYLYATEDGITTSIVIDNANNVYFGGEDGLLYSVKSTSTTANPQLNWSYQLGGEIVHIVLGDGVLYAITDELKIYVLE